jgi:hypothetical protein
MSIEGAIVSTATETNVAGRDLVARLLLIGSLSY